MDGRESMRRYHSMFYVPEDGLVSLDATTTRHLAHQNTHLPHVSQQVAILHFEQRNSLRKEDSFKI